MSGNILFKIELFQLAQILFFGLPHAVHHILDVEDEVCLAVASISERHVGRIGLGNGCQSQVRRPSLDHYHITSDQARSVGAASCIGSAPEHHGFVIVGWISQDFVELHCKSVKVTDVERTKVSVEGIVQQCVVDGEVDWWWAQSGGSWGGLRLRGSLLR
jgi:hypothetical protein